MVEIGFRPEGNMGRQALEALEDLLYSDSKSDILWAGQRLEAIAAQGSRMNSSDRSKLHSELGYLVSRGLGGGPLGDLRRKILGRAFTKLDSTF